ncbi:MAG: hypothetical protein KBH11_13675 [Bacteroidia bacterium]|nr:hypothetical protein [Bacteroidota bacterium]MBP9084126.1 hypothetical protein [Bacteroidia bacterium]
MRINLALLLGIIIFSNQTFAQYTWTAKNDFPGLKRYAGSAFSINNLGYFGCGADFTGNFSNVYKDFWQYNTGSDTWIQIADIPLQRYSAIDFSLDGFGYVGTGWTVLGSAATSTFYKYNPTSNTWTLIAPLPGSNRYTGVGLSNGLKGYGGFGYAPLRKDFYEYNAVNDIWTPVTTFPSTERQSLNGFTIGTDVYVGCGYTSSPRNDFWKYDPVNGTWTQTADYPVPNYASVGFTLNNKGIVGLGRNNTVQFNSFFEYDPTSNSWTALPPFPSTGREGSDVFVLNGCAYIIGGRTGSNNYLKEVWQLCLTTSLEDNEELPFELNLYSQDQFINIAFNSEDGSKYELNIHDVTGRKIFTGKLQSSYNEQINVASGIYVYAVNKNNKIVKTGKVAVN